MAKNHKEDNDDKSSKDDKPDQEDKQESSRDWVNEAAKGVVGIAPLPPNR